MGIDMLKRKHIIDVSFFLTYPTLCFIILWFRLSRFLNDYLIAFFALIAFLSSVLFQGFEKEESISRHTLLYMAWVGLLFSITPILSEFELKLFFGGSLLLAHVLSFILLQLEKEIRIFKPKNGFLVITIFFFFTFSTSVLTTVNLVEVNSVLSLFPTIAFGLVFGWFSREFGHRLYKSELGGIGGGGIQFIMFFTTGILVLLIPKNSILYFLNSDYGSFFPSIFWVIPTMLVSRLTSEYLKSFPK